MQGVLQAFPRRERMMGLEPTTFCMATGEHYIEKPSKPRKY
jgi:hypothetical protein